METSTELENSLSYWANKVLNTADPKEKCQITNLVAEKWRQGELELTGCAPPPDEPSRKNNLNVVDPSKIKRGKGGTIVI